MIDRLRGHVLTIAPTLRHRFWPLSSPPARAWTTALADERRGSITLTGRLHETAGADAIVVVVHGLGGSYESYYTILAARAACARGHAVLRLNLRGADGSGADLYHAGLTRDIHAALASDALAKYRRILLVGYSVGGHMSLRVATEDCDARLSAVAAIHAPLDLAASSAAIDRWRATVYRVYLLRQLQNDYRRLHERFGGPIAPARAGRIHLFREWDDRVTAPIWGFSGVEDYYRRASVVPHLDQLRVPALLVVEKRDPMVPPSAIAPYVQRLRARMTVRWTDSGGHVGYSPGFSGRSADAMERRVLDWLDAR